MIILLIFAAILAYVYRYRLAKWYFAAKLVCIHKASLLKIQIKKILYSIGLL